MSNSEKKALKLYDSDTGSEQLGASVSKLVLHIVVAFMLN